MFARGITGFALLGADLATAGYASLKLRSDFVASSFLEGVGATTTEDDASYRDKDRKGPHPLILGTKRLFANCGLWNSDCGFRGQNRDVCSIRNPQSAMA